MSEELTSRTDGDRLPLCRLCLHEYPEDDLHEIFNRGSYWRNRITQAVGIKPHQDDYATRMCSTCLVMIDLIVSFQHMCQQTERLMIKGLSVSGDHWSQASGLINSLWSLLDQHWESVLEADVEREQEQCVIKEEKESDAEEGNLKEPMNIRDELNDENGHDYNVEADLVDKGKEPQRKRIRRRKYNDSEQKSKIKKVVCDTCGELITLEYMEGHQNRHLGVQPYECEIEGCGARLYSKYSLNAHRHSHKSKMRYYDCPDCGKRIKGTRNWNQHRQRHTGEPKHECVICGKKFYKKFALTIHSVVHTGLALFPCEICGKRFTVKHNLGAHYKTHMRNGTYPATGVGSRQEQIQKEEQSYPAEQEQNCTVGYDSVQ